MPAPIIPTSFETARDGDLRNGKRPVVFDILAPDKRRSILPDDIRMVLHVNPRSMRLNYQKIITRIQTKGGFVEQHWGDGLQDINFDFATGGFVRLFSGLSNKTGSIQGGSATTATQGRRETLGYDRFLDLLSLFLGNGAIYDANGNIVLQGYLQVLFEGESYIGWFDADFSISEAAEQPYQFALTARFIVDEERRTFRSTVLNGDFSSQGEGPSFSNQPVFPAANFAGFFSEP